ncbi:hypothetical protein N9301_09415 [Paracoccaceae bacterium]|nr:hypothetical protein [Paracoccaceae bacterium]
MGETIKFDGKEYDTENLSDKAIATLSLLQFTIKHLLELKKMEVILVDAKITNAQNLKREMLSGKTGFQFDED